MSGRSGTGRMVGWGAVAMLAAASWNANAAPGRSTNIALSPDGGLLLNVNHDAGSLTVFEVGAGGASGLSKLAEVGVGREPNCVAILPDGSEAFVTNSDGTVSVVSLTGPRRFSETGRIKVGTEPRGCALTPTGAILYVANFTAGTVSIVSTANQSVIATTSVSFGNPFAVAVSDDGDNADDDETVFVTDFFAEKNPSGGGEGFDNGRRGVVRAFPVGDFNFVRKINLPPVADSGFTADRTAFCPQSAAVPPHSNIFCPDINVAADSPVIKTAVQGAFPNQLFSLLARGQRLFVPSIAAAPAPPVAFNTNLQALVHVIDSGALTVRNETVNLNAQIKLEVQPPNPAESLARLFAGDIVAMDAPTSGGTFLFVSRGGDYAIEAKLVSGKLSIGAPDNVVRFRTGHTPTGIAVAGDGSRAYVNNEVGRSVSVLDLGTNQTLARDVESSPLPQPGSVEHAAAMGKLVFFTSLGVPDDGLRAKNIRSIDTLASRQKASDNGWSSCASCHPAGLADGVTWIFGDGPRQTIPLDATFSKLDGHDFRILNWSAVRGSVTDFNNNSKGVQGGLGFAGNPSNPNVFNHGITHGASEALDMETLWVQTVRPLDAPSKGQVAGGRNVFESRCASCHGGSKWTKSEVIYKNNPTLPSNGGAPTDPGLTVATGGQIQSYASGGKVIAFLESIGTFSADNPLEIKASGGLANGSLGFNVPSLIGVGSSAPYFHDGSARTLGEVFEKHALGGGTIATELSAANRSKLTDFLSSVDGTTLPLRGEIDDFRDPL